MGADEAAVKITAHQRNAVVLTLGKDLGVVADGVHFIDDDLIGLADKLLCRTVNVRHRTHDVGVLHLGIAVFFADLAAGEHAAQIARRRDLLVVLLGRVNAGVKLAVGATQRFIAKRARDFDVLHGDNAFVKREQTHCGNGDRAVEHGQALFVGELQALNAVFGQHLIRRQQLAMIVDLAFADVSHDEVALDAEPSPGAQG